MLVDRNEAISLQKCPWNALCKNTPFFKIKFLGEFFNQAPQQHNFCTVKSLLMLQNSLGYAINKLEIFYRVPEKIVIFEKIKENIKKRFMNISSDCFFIQNFDYLCKNGRRNWISPLMSCEKRNWISPLMSCEKHYLSIGQGLTL